MDLLWEAARVYRKLTNKEIVVTFGNDEFIRIIFKDANFVHLAGLNKLADIAIMENSARYIFKMILKGRITWDDLNKSVFFDAQARERIKSLSRIGELLVADGRAIFPFDPAKCRARVSFKSRAIFFKEDGYDFYITFGAAQDKSGEYYYPETMFYRYDGAYIDNQNVVSIKSVEAKPYNPKKLVP